MNFEKKYWSEGEFTTLSGSNYIGYVGIYKNKAYIYTTEEELYNNDKYICRINRSKDNFDRVLSNELKLPYGKRDIIFAANDFLYSATLQTAIERLEANNNYIFKNSIISNSTLPDTDNCTIFISDGSETNAEARGILKASNFSSGAFSGKTAKDPTFYPQSKTAHKFIARDILGKSQDYVTEKTSFIYTPEGDRDKTYDIYKINLSDKGEKSAKEIWIEINGNNVANYENGRISDKNSGNINEIFDSLKGDLQSNFYQGNKIDIKDYFYSTISLLNESISDISFVNNNELIANLTDTRLLNAVDINITSDENNNQLINEENINFKLNTLYFIADIENGKNIEINLPTAINFDKENTDILTYSLEKNDLIDKNLYFVKCIFKTPVIFSKNLLTNEGIKIELNVSNIKGILVDKNNYLACDYRYTIGTEGSLSSNYKTIPHVTRLYKHQYVWTDDKLNGNVKFAPYTYTYKYLTESAEWLNAKNPRLVYVDVDLAANYSDFIPENNMTANDVYEYMKNNIESYNDFPDLYLNTIYEFNNGKNIVTSENLNEIAYINNGSYKNIIYSTDNYKIENGKISKAYKLPADIFRDLSNKPKEGLPYDKIPIVEKINYVDIPDTNLLKHNFNNITASNIVLTKVENGVADLMLFITFKTKLLIIKTKYYYENEEKNFNNEFNLSDSGKNIQFIELDRINPNDSTSIKFMNLNAIKIYKNMLYLIDSDLNMVLRYDIDLLTSPDEDINTFDIASIKFINMLQGLGKSSDKIYFNKPYSIDVTDNRAYIVDRNNKCVKAYTPGLNYIKTLKNGFFSAHDIQAVAVNPHSCIINNKEIPAESLWIVSVLNKRIFISVLYEDIVMAYGQIEDISLISDKYSWLEEVRGINFSQTNSNYFYLNTNKRVYKFHVSTPFYPFASISYYKQRSIVGTMKWSKMNYPWHRIPSLYGAVTDDTSIDNQVTWNYMPPTTSAEILDNKCFTLIGSPEFEGDIIFHYGILYDNSKIQSYIKENSPLFEGEMTFNDIDLGNLANMIKSSAILLYKEGDSFISSLSNNEVKVYDSYKFNEDLEEDYINSLTFNKMLYSVVYNLLKIKNSLFGRFKAATNIDNVIVYDSLVLDDYFNMLQINNEADYFIHDNEITSIIVNRTLESIYNLQEKIINKMQTTFMATQSYVNNTSRII